MGGDRHPPFAPPVQAQLAQKRAEPGVVLGPARVREALNRVSHCGVESGAGERLEQVVQRVDLERPKRKGIVRGDEDDRRDVGGLEILQHGESVQLGHLNVEEDQLRSKLLDRVQGLPPIRAVTHHLHLGKLGQQQA